MHILLLILKIIGIILLIIAGLLLLAVITVLFVPVRYRILADYHGHFKGKLTRSKGKYLRPARETPLTFVVILS